MNERILDFGIGEGGKYLLNDGPKIIRVGVDKNFDKLACDLPEEYKGKVSSFLVAESDLPFVNGSFDKVQILFPSDELAQGLCSSDFSLWTELNRVLKKNGSVEIYLDVSVRDLDGVLVCGGNQEIEEPLPKILSTCEKFGFHPKSTELSHESVQKLGTEVSEMVAPQMKIPLVATSVYLISAQKE